MLRKLTALAALLMAIVMLSGCLGINELISDTRFGFDTPAPEIVSPEAEAAPPSEPAATEQPLETAEPEVTVESYFAPVEHVDVDFNSLEISHYETDEFFAKLDEFIALGAADGSDVADIQEIYDWLYEQYTLASTQYTLVKIAFDKDPQDKDMESEYQYYEVQLTDMIDRLAIACRDMLDSQYGEAMRAFFGDTLSEAFDEYEDMTDRQKEMTERESELTTEYYSIVGDDARYNVKIDGKEYTLENVSTVYQKYGWDTYVETYYAIEAQYNKRLGEIYLELVSMRHEDAEIEGYTSFADYAYEEVFYRDYTTDDAKSFHAAVKANVGPRFFKEIYSADNFWDDPSDISMTTDELMENVRIYAAGISPETEAAFDYMIRNNLYCIGDDDAMTASGYTTTLDAYSAPFIYNKTSGSYRDLSDTCHEFGHYVDAYYHPQENALLSGSCYDVFEVHSTGMELLVNVMYPDIYGTKSNELQARQLGDMLYTIVYGCIMDEFQQYVYTTPNLTLDDLNDAYYRICKEYGMIYANYEDHDYGWMWIPHNFESPMYYISYATSSLTSLEIWSTAVNEGREAAIDKYLSFVAIGAEDIGYLEILEMNGMRSFMDAGYVDEVTAPVFEITSRFFE